MRIKRVCWWLGCASSVAFVVAPKCAQAQEPGPLQLTLHSTVFQYSRPKEVWDDAPTVEAKGSIWQAGLFRSGMGAGVGYRLSNVLVGMRASFMTQRIDSSPSGAITNDSQTNSDLSLLPRVEYLLTRGAFRPFVAGMVGYQHGWHGGSSDRRGALPVHNAYSGTTNGISYGAAFGLHAFLSRWLSIDPELALLASSSKLTTHGTVSGAGADSMPSDSTSKRTSSDIALMLNIGLSGWVGGS